MRDFQQRKKVRKILYSRNSVIVLAVVTVFLARGAIGVLQKNWESKKNVEMVELQLAEARVKSAELKRDISLINTEAGMEREIRQKFSVSKGGEQVAIVVEPRPTSTNVDQTPNGFWASVVAWFRGLF